MIATKRSIIGVTSTVAICVALIAVWRLASSPAAPPGDVAPILLEVPRGSRNSEIAGLLVARGLVRSRLAFTLATVLTRTRGRLRPGWYELHAAMSPMQIARKLEAGEIARAKVTIPEGWTLRQIASALERARVCSARAFIEAATPATVAARHPDLVLPGPTLEGFLFPETYRFAVGAAPEDVAAEMVGQFVKVFWEPHRRTTPPAPLKDLRDVVILASLVEREARWAQERARIAGVLVNRLRIGMRLQCDATVQYALGEHRARLTYRDLRVRSPYNTYLHNGLPPGPICSPGLAALEAALEPETNPYLFYVATADGHHLFSRTFEEHRAAIAKVRGGEQRAPR